MWARMQEMGIKREAPIPLEVGKTVEGFRIKGDLKPIRGFRRYTAVREWQTYELRQFYDVYTDAFLRWQNQARLAALPAHAQLLHAEFEWSGGYALPEPRLPSLASWLPADRAMRLSLAVSLAALLAGVHAAGYVHHDLHPGAVLMRRARPILRNFSRCTLRGRQDLWCGFAGNRAPLYAAPEQIHGKRGTAASDVYAFGLLLKHIFEERLPPYWLKQAVCELRFGWESLCTLFPPKAMPADLGRLATAALAYAPEDRPTMDEICSELGVPVEPIPRLPPPRGNSRGKVLALVSPDRHAPAIFERACELGRQGASILIVSLVPINLVFGELELFKVRLFKALAAGLARLRAERIDWGILFRENVDPNAAVRQLCTRLEPDLTLCGPPSRKGVGARVHPGVGNVITQTGCTLERPEKTKESDVGN